MPATKGRSFSSKGVPICRDSPWVGKVASRFAISSGALSRAILLLTFALAWCILSPIAKAVMPVGEPQLDRPTLHSLGIYWIIRDDPGRAASIRLEYRKVGASAWRAGAPSLRVEAAGLIGRRNSGAGSTCRMTAGYSRVAH